MTMIEFEVIDDETGDEVVLSLPAKMEVCHDCEGHGTHLAPGMRFHAYSQEEFYEEFDDEDREQYFTRGGMYDVMCETCKGKNVIAVVNENACRTEEQKALLKRYYDIEKDKAMFRREQEAERRMGC